MTLSLGIMSGQKQNLLLLMIICCAPCQISTGCTPVVDTCRINFITSSSGLPNDVCKATPIKSDPFTLQGSSDKLIIQVNSSDHCFWKESSSTVPDIKRTCLPDDEETITLNISSLGQCESYSFSITKDDENYEIRMNETVEGITLWLVPNGDGCLKNITTYYQSNCTNSSFSIFSDVYLSNGNPILSDNSTDCSKTSHLDAKESCANTTYNNTCGGSKYRYILTLEDSEWMCVKCDNTTGGESNTEMNTTTSFTQHTTITHNSTITKKPTTTLNPTKSMGSPSTDKQGYTDPSKASSTLSSLESMIEYMENNNKSNEAIVKENAVGLVHVQAKKTETKEINICYSSDQAMVVESQSDMNTNSSWSVKISKEALNKSRLENNGTAFVGVLRFYNMTNEDDTKNLTILNNEVYGITMRANISNLTDNIDMYFRHNDKVGKPSCSSWDGKGELKWKTSGCVTETIDNTVKCSCSHLTFFAVLMSPPDASNNTVPDLEQLTLITSIGCGISMFFLAIALFMHFLLRKAKSNQATKILMNMFVALSLLNASFLSNESVANTGDNAACVFIALLLHYSMLASFTWFFIQALHMYLWLIRQNVSITNYMRKITVLGWVFPAPIVIAIASVGEYKTVIIKSTSEKISRMCWITNSYIHYIVNIGYYALVFIFTTGIFIMIVTKVVQARNIKAVDGKRKTFRKQLMMVLSLFLLFGLTWSVAFFSYGPMLIPSYYIFTVLNSFQGFFLFLYYYHIHNDVAGSFSDDPENTDSNTTITQSSINAVDNIYH